MNRSKAIICIKAILETLAETNGGPESYLYLPFSTQGILDLDQFQTLMGIMQKNKWIEVKSHYVTITDLGREAIKGGANG